VGFAVSWGGRRRREKRNRLGGLCKVWGRILESAFSALMSALAWIGVCRVTEENTLNDVLEPNAERKVKGARETMRTRIRLWLKVAQGKMAARWSSVRARIVASVSAVKNMNAGALTGVPARDEKIDPLTGQKKSQKKAPPNRRGLSCLCGSTEALRSCNTFRTRQGAECVRSCRLLPT